MTIEESKQIDAANCPKFSDFARDKMPMPGVKKKVSEILGKPITIIDFKIKPSKKNEGKDCLTLQFLCDGELCILFTSSGVLIDQILSSEQTIPFNAAIIEVNERFLSFS